MRRAGTVAGAAGHGGRARFGAWGLRVAAALAAVTVTGAGMVSVAGAAGAAVSGVYPGKCGSVLLAGSAWLGGKGVDVKSNGPYEGLGTDCSTAISSVNGHRAGEEWQCVEMINRLYLTRGWISGTWWGSAGPAFWGDTPGNLSKQPDGQVSYLGPGDVVVINVFDNGTLEGGHALVVNDSSRVTGGTVDLVSQNSGEPGDAIPQVPGYISGGHVTVGGGGGGWTYQTIGVVHAPTSATPPPTAYPSVPSITGTSGDLLNSVTVSWSPSTGGTGGIASYQVFRDGQQLATVPGGTTSYTDTSLPRGSTLTYAVRAVDGAGHVSGLSPPISVDTTLPGESGLAWVAAGRSGYYCRRTGVGPHPATQHLECTELKGHKWHTYLSPGGIDWGYPSGRAWLTVAGHPTYCRLTGVGPSFATQHLECTEFNGRKWHTHLSPGGIDWGYPTGRAWLTVGKRPTYCRQTGMGGSFATQHLECTEFNGRKWHTYLSPGGIDWGYPSGWSWLTVGKRPRPTYCRQTGVGPSFATQHLECTEFNGRKWHTYLSPGGIDWGYPVGWSWLGGRTATYCRQTGVGPSFATQHLECTELNGRKWHTYLSPGGIDWGYPSGWSWLTVGKRPTYCRLTGVGPDPATQNLECTEFNGRKWHTHLSPGGIDWGYPTGRAWLTVAGHPTYCRQTGTGGDLATQHLECTEFNGRKWHTHLSPGGIDWGYDN